MRLMFQFNERKAVEVLAWLAGVKPGMSFHQVVKVLYFADKAHLSRYGRPILGDRYIAMEHGMVPSAVYNMLKKDAFLGEHLVDAVEGAIKVERGNGPPRLFQKRAADEDYLSGSDKRCLQEAVDRYGDESFEELRRLAHLEPAWEAANLNSEMDYELILTDLSNKEEVLDRLRESAAYIVF